MQTIFDPPTIPLDSDTHIHRSKNAPATAALIAASLLSYHGVERGKDGDPVYLLVDPHKLGNEFERRFSAGVLAPVNPKLYSDAWRFLMNEVRRIRETSGVSR